MSFHDITSVVGSHLLVMWEYPFPLGFILAGAVLIIVGTGSLLLQRGGGFRSR